MSFFERMSVLSSITENFDCIENPDGSYTLVPKKNSKKTLISLDSQSSYRIDAMNTDDYNKGESEAKLLDSHQNYIEDLQNAWKSDSEKLSSRPPVRTRDDNLHSAVLGYIDSLENSWRE